MIQVLIDIFLRKSITAEKKLLVVSKLAKSEGDTFLNALKANKDRAPQSHRFFYRHFYARGGGVGGALQVDDPTIQTSATSFPTKHSQTWQSYYLSLSFRQCQWIFTN